MNMIKFDGSVQISKLEAICVHNQEVKFSLQIQSADKDKYQAQGMQTTCTKYQVFNILTDSYIITW